MAITGKLTVGKGASQVTVDIKGKLANPADKAELIERLRHLGATTKYNFKVKSAPQKKKKAVRRKKK